MKTIAQKNRNPVLSSDEDLVQMNARVPRAMKDTVKRAAKVAGVDLEKAAQDAWKLYFGINDSMLESRRATLLGAFKLVTKGQKRPFETPLTPDTNNACLTSRGDSATFSTSN